MKQKLISPPSKKEISDWHDRLDRMTLQQLDDLWHNAQPDHICFMNEELFIHFACRRAVTRASGMYTDLPTSA